MVKISNRKTRSNQFLFSELSIDPINSSCLIALAKNFWTLKCLSIYSFDRETLQEVQNLIKNYLFNMSKHTTVKWNKNTLFLMLHIMLFSVYSMKIDHFIWTCPQYLNLIEQFKRLSYKTVYAEQHHKASMELPSSLTLSTILKQSVWTLLNLNKRYML